MTKHSKKSQVFIEETMNEIKEGKLPISNGNRINNPLHDLQLAYLKEESIELKFLKRNRIKQKSKNCNQNFLK